MLSPSLSTSQDIHSILSCFHHLHCPLPKCTKQPPNLPCHRQTRPALAYLLQTGPNVTKLHLSHHSVFFSLHCPSSRFPLKTPILPYTRQSSQATSSSIRLAMQLRTRLSCCAHAWSLRMLISPLSATIPQSNFHRKSSNPNLVLNPSHSAFLSDHSSSAAYLDSTPPRFFFLVPSSVKDMDKSPTS